MHISKSQWRTFLVLSLFLIGCITQFVQSGQILGVTVTKPVASALPSPTLAPSPLPSQSLGLTETYPVASVTDGDTFKVLIDGKKTTVRIVGINTPETVDPRRPVQCFGKEASNKLKELLANKTVRLEPDATQQNTDKYGRLLRFVFLEDGTDVGKLMIEQGYAHESLYSKTPYKYRQEYLDAQQRAQEQKQGLWGDQICPVQ